MISPKINRHLVYALYLNAAILLAILVAVLGRGRSVGLGDAALAQSVSDQLPITGGNGIYVMPCQLHPSVWGCYLIDTQRQTMCIYEYRGGEKNLVLSAARNFRFDLDLKNYNTYPAWYDIQKAVEEAAKNEKANESQLPSLAVPAPRENNP